MKGRKEEQENEATIKMQKKKIKEKEIIEW